MKILFDHRFINFRLLLPVGSGDKNYLFFRVLYRLINIADKRLIRLLFTFCFTYRRNEPVIVEFAYRLYARKRSEKGFCLSNSAFFCNEREIVEPTCLMYAVFVFLYPVGNFVYGFTLATKQRCVNCDNTETRTETHGVDDSYMRVGIFFFNLFSRFDHKIISARYTRRNRKREHAVTVFNPFFKSVGALLNVRRRSRKIVRREF